ncbi:MAG: hypothetical protein ACI8RZ_001387 [Myxococcota bacterium]|jgi:hypothetical protein
MPDSMSHFEKMSGHPCTIRIGMIARKMSQDAEMVR